MTGPLTVAVVGDYTTNPTSIAAEPVTGCGLTGATVAMTMGVLAANLSTPGAYTAIPTNPVAQGTAAGGETGVTFNFNGLWQAQGPVFSAIPAGAVADPDISNVNGPTAAYLGQPLVQGYVYHLNSDAVGHYNNSLTESIVAVGNVGQHQGQMLMTQEMSGAFTFGAEVNQVKFYQTVAAGTTLTAGYEALEIANNTSGTIAGWSGILINPLTKTGGSSGTGIGVKLVPGVQSGATLSGWLGINCNPVGSGGAATHASCIYNSDPVQDSLPKATSTTSVQQVTNRPSLAQPAPSHHRPDSPTT